MPTITPPNISRAEAQIALVYLMLTEHGRSRANEMVVLNGALYRINVERVPPAEAPEAARRFIDDHQ